MNVRVFIVDDHELFRSGVRSELKDGVEIAGDAATVEEAIPAILASAPDVVLIDSLQVNYVVHKCFFPN